MASVVCATSPEESSMKTTNNLNEPKTNEKWSQNWLGSELGAMGSHLPMGLKLLYMDHTYHFDRFKKLLCPNNWFN